MILDEILRYKKAYLKGSQKTLSYDKLLRRLKQFKLVKRRNFRKALTSQKRISLIAETKKASPSGGTIVSKYDPAKIAKVYEVAGASCISVLTDVKFFNGSLSHLNLIKKAVNLPILRKDFIIDPYQVFESALLGADAVLLIARILSKKEMMELMEICRNFKMASLIEVHSKKDIDKAIEADANLIGINNRNLDTLKIDLKTTEKLIKHIPKRIVKISESGISKREDIEYLENLGIDAVLIGESLLRSKNIKKKIKELFYF